MSYLLLCSLGTNFLEPRWQFQDCNLCSFFHTRLPWLDGLFYTKQRGGRGLNVTLRDVIHHGYYYGLHKTYYPKLGVFCTHNPTPTINCCDGRIQKFCFLSQKRFIFYYGRTYTLSKLTFQKVNGTLNFSKVMFILEVKF